MIRAAAITGLAILMIAGGHAAHADSRRAVGILDVRTEGLSKEVAATFQTNLEEQLDSSHYALLTRATLRQRMERSTGWTEGCVVGACLREVRSQTGAELVVLAALTGSGTTYGYVITLLRTDTGQVVSQVTERCDVCTANEAVANATIATLNLVTSAPDILPDEPGLRVAAMTAHTRAALAPLHEQARRRSHHAHSVGWTLAIAGVAIAIAGGVVVATGEHAWGATGLGAGLGLAAGGVTILSF